MLRILTQTRRYCVVYASLMLSYFIFTPLAQAQTDYYWAQPAGTSAAGNFSTATNWFFPIGTVPPASTVNSLNFAVFSNTTTSTFTLTNDVGSYTINSALTFNNFNTVDSTSFTLALGANTFTMAAGSAFVNNGPTKVTISGGTGGIALVGNVSVLGSGNGHTNVTGVIGGSGSLIVNMTGNSTFGLSGPNTFTGGITLTSGYLSLGNATALGNVSNVLTVNGGAIRSTTTSIIPNNIIANSTLVFANGNGGLGATSTPILSGVISGAGGLSIISSNTIASGANLSNANTFTGPVLIDAYVNNSLLNTNGSTSGGILTLSGAAGALVNSTSITVGHNNTFVVGATTANGNRINDTATITLNGGRLTYVPVTSGTNETIGNLVIGGHAHFAGTASGVNTIFATNFSRLGNATAYLDTTNYGTITSAITANKIVFSGTTPLVLAAGSGTGQETGVVPYMVSSSSTNPQSFVTYNPTNGLAVFLNTDTTRVLNQIAGAISAATVLNKNVRFNGAGTYTLTGVNTINALTTTGTTVAVTGGTLNIFSGVIVNFDSLSFTNTTIGFGVNTGYMYNSFPFLVTGTSSVTGTAGVVVAGNRGTSGSLVFNNTVANNFTGGLTINGPTYLAYTDDNQLGAAGGTITLSGGALSWNQAADHTMNRDIVIESTDGGYGFNVTNTLATTAAATANTVVTLGGTISGAGSFLKNGLGIVNLTGSNNYQGGTEIAAGTLQFTTESNLGQAGSRVVLNGGTFQPLTAVTLSRPIEVNANTTIDNTAGLTINGSISNIGVLYRVALPTITKAGVGNLTINGDAAKISGNLSIAGGSVTLAGTTSTTGGIPQMNSITLSAGTTLTIGSAGSYNPDRIGDAASIVLSGTGSIVSYIAPTTAPNATAERIGVLVNSAAGNVFSVAGSPGGVTTIRLGVFTTTGALTFRGDNLGSLTPGAGTTQIFIDTLLSNQPIIPNVFFANTAGTGTSTSPTGYDLTRGIIQFIPVVASGISINNFAPDNHSVATDFTTTGDTTASTGASIYALTLNVGSILTLNGGNPPSATNNNTADGTLAILGGLLTSQNGNKSIVIGSASPAVIAFGGSIATVTTTSDLDIASGITVSGTGGLTKAGSGTLTINGTYSVTGSLVLAAGTISLPSVTSLSGITANGGALSAPSLSTVTGPVVVNSGSLTLNTNTLPSLEINGGTFTGTSLTSITGAFTLNSASTTYVLNAGQTIAGPITLTSGTFDISAISGFTLTNLTGGATMLAGSQGFFLNNTANSTFSGILNGSLGFSKSGASILTLSSPTTLPLTGTVFINAGAIQLGASDVFNAATVLQIGPTGSTTTTALNLNGFNQTLPGITIVSGSGTRISLGTGTLTLTGNIDYVNNTTTNGNGSSSNTIAATTGGINLGGGVQRINVAGQNNGTTPDFIVNGFLTNGSIEFNGINSTTFPLVFPWIAYSGTNTTASTAVLSSVLRTDSLNALPATGTLSLGTPASGISGQVNMNGFNQTVEALAVPADNSGTANIIGSSVLATLTLNSPVAGTFTGRIGGVIGSATTVTANAVNFVKSGNAAYDLQGANGYTGTTTVNPGATAGGGLTFSLSGTSLAAGVLTVGNGTAFRPTLAFDNTATDIPNRYTPTAAVTLNNGAITLLGNSAGTASTLGALTVTAASTNNFVTVTSNPSSTSSLTFSSLTIGSGGRIVFAGTSLGEIGTFSRIFFTTAPTLVNGVIPNAFYGTYVDPNTNKATYDPTRGLILLVGPQPFSGTVIDNFAPTSLPTNAAFTSTGNVTVNAAVKIQSLVLDVGTTATIFTPNPSDPLNENTAVNTFDLSTGTLTSQNGAKLITGSGILNVNFGTLTTTSNMTIDTGVTLTGSTLTKLGAGSLTVNGTYSISGNLTVNAGTLNTSSLSSFVARNLSGTGDAVTAGTNALVLDITAPSSFSGAITAGSLTKNGTATYTMGTSATLNSGLNLIINNGVFATNGNNITVGTLLFGGGSSASSGPGLTTGSGKITLGGNVTFAPVDYSATTSTPVQLVPANIDLGGGNRTFFGNGYYGSTTTSYDIIFSGVISGAGGIKLDSTVGNNASYIAFTGTSTFSGTFSTEIGYGGFAYIAATNAFSNNVAWLLNSPGTLFLNPLTSENGVVAGNYNQSIGSLAGTGLLNLGSATLTTGNDGTSTTYSGVLSGTGGNLVKLGNGVFTLSVANTYTGTTTIQPGSTSGGGITFGGSGSANSAGALFIGNGAANVPTLTFDNTSTNIVRYTATAAVTLNNGSINLIGSSAGSSQALGSLSATGGTANLINVTSTTATSTLTFASLAPITGANRLIFTGNNLGVAGAGNSKIVFTALPALSGGFLPNAFIGSISYFNRATYDAALGVKLFPFSPTGTLIDNIGSPSLPTDLATFTTTGNTTVNAGAKLGSLILDGGSTINLVQVNVTTPGQGGLLGGNDNTPIGTFVLTGSLTSQNGTKTVTATTAGILQLDSGTITTTSDLAISSNITLVASSLNKSGAGNLILTGTNTITGTTTVSAGTLTLVSNLPATTTVAIGTGATLAGTASVLGSATATGSAAINFGVGGSIAGTLGVTGGTWNGIGSVGESITSTSGAFTVGSGATLTANGGATVIGGTFGSASGSTIILAASTSFNYTSDLTSTLNGTLTGAGSLSVNNATANLILNGASLYTGTTNITAGTLTSNNSLYSPGGTITISTAGAGGTLQASGVIQRSIVASTTTASAPAKIIAIGDLTIGNVSTGLTFLGTLSPSGYNVGISSSAQTVTNQFGDVVARPQAQLRFVTMANGSVLGSNSALVIRGSSASDSITVPAGASATINGNVFFGYDTKWRVTGEPAQSSVARVNVGAGATLTLNGVVRGNRIEVVAAGGAVNVTGADIVGFSPGIVFSQRTNDVVNIGSTIYQLFYPTPRSYNKNDVFNSPTGSLSLVNVTGVTTSVTATAVLPGPGGGSPINILVNSNDSATANRFVPRAGDTFRLVDTDNSWLNYDFETETFVSVTPGSKGIINNTTNGGLTLDQVVFRNYNGTSQVTSGNYTLPQDLQWSLNVVTGQGGYVDLVVTPEPGAILGLSAAVFGLGRWIRRRRNYPQQ